MNKLPSGSFRHHNCPTFGATGAVALIVVAAAGVTQESVGPACTTSDLPISAGALGTGGNQQSVAHLARVTFASAIFAVVTARSLIFAVVTPFGASAM